MKQNENWDVAAEMKPFTLSVTRNEELTIEAARLERDKNPTEQLKNLPLSIREFYLQANGYRLGWEHNRFKNNRFVQGRVNIQKLEEVLVEGKGLLWFDNTPKDDPIRNFRILDYVTDEVFVGFYTGVEAEDMLYYYSISDTPKPLQLDMRGYLAMMRAAYGFKFWQKAILTLIDGTDYPETETLRKYLPQILEGFTFEKFTDTFNSVKI